MHESSKHKQKSSNKRVNHKGSLFSHTKRRGGLDRLKERVSRRAKSAYDKGEKIYKKAKELYDSVDPSTKAIAKKGYESYKKKRAQSERIEKSRKEWQERSKSK